MTQKETQESINLKSIQEKMQRGIVSKKSLNKRKYKNSSVKSSTTNLSAVDLLYVKSFKRLPRLRTSTGMKTSPQKAQEKYKIANEYGYLENAKEVYRVSYPCFSGCATCAFTQCFGPVKVFFSQFKEPKECFVREIKDGQGRTVIPKSRRKEFRGLVYDKQTHSLYPPLPRGHTSSELQINSMRKIFY